MDGQPISLQRYLYGSDDPLDMSDAGGQDDLAGTLVSLGISSILTRITVGATVGALAGIGHAYVTGGDLASGTEEGAVVGGLIGAVPTAYAPVVINLVAISTVLSIEFDLIDGNNDAAVYDAGIGVLGAAAGVGELGSTGEPTAPSPGATGAEFYNEIAAKTQSFPDSAVASEPGKALFYSGKGADVAAKNLAKDGKYDIIDNTDGGKYLKTEKLYDNEKLSPDVTIRNNMADSLWAMLSARYAENAQGQVTAIVNQPRDYSVYATVEKPILQWNDKVTDINEFIGIPRKP